VKERERERERERESLIPTIKVKSMYFEYELGVKVEASDES
jgi:hypothetical protein